MTTPRNKSQGRKRIEMKLVKKKSCRMVTFSKRRASLFGKASELATLCGAHLAVMIFSPGGKIYSFGHPNVEAVVERFESLARPTGASHLIKNSDPYGDEFMRMAAYRAEKTRRLKMVLEEILAGIEAEKRKSRMLDVAWETEHAARFWWTAPIKEMNLGWCKEMEKRLKEVKMKVELEVRRNQFKDSGKDFLSQTLPGRTFAPGRGRLVPNPSAGSFYPSTFVSGWINFGAGPSNAAASTSPMINLQSSGGASSFGDGPGHINYRNFTF